MVRHHQYLQIVIIHRPAEHSLLDVAVVSTDNLAETVVSCLARVDQCLLGEFYFSNLKC